MKWQIRKGVLIWKRVKVSFKPGVSSRRRLASALGAICMSCSAVMYCPVVGALGVAGGKPGAAVADAIIAV